MAALEVLFFSDKLLHANDKHLVFSDISLFASDKLLSLSDITSNYLYIICKQLYASLLYHEVDSC
ncbi:hypothetical protein PSMA106859_11140 [Pseudoalteromonas maricaloris]